MYGYSHEIGYPRGGEHLALKSTLQKRAAIFHAVGLLGSLKVDRIGYNTLSALESACYQMVVRHIGAEFSLGYQENGFALSHGHLNGLTLIFRLQLKRHVEIR